MSADERIERARLLYERFVFGGEASVLAAADRELDAVEADLALARGRVMHGRFLAQRDNDPAQLTQDPRELVLFERAAELYRELGDVPGEAESLFWVGCFHQVVRRDNDVAVPVLEQSCELAASDKLTMSDALRHLGIAAHVAGRGEHQPGAAGGVGADSPGDRAHAQGCPRTRRVTRRRRTRPPRQGIAACGDAAAAIAEAGGTRSPQAAEVRERPRRRRPAPRTVETRYPALDLKVHRRSPCLCGGCPWQPGSRRSQRPSRPGCSLPRTMTGSGAETAALAQAWKTQQQATRIQNGYGAPVVVGDRHSAAHWPTHLGPTAVMAPGLTAGVPWKPAWRVAVQTILLWPPGCSAAAATQQQWRPRDGNGAGTHADHGGQM